MKEHQICCGDCLCETFLLKAITEDGELVDSVVKCARCGFVFGNLKTTFLEDTEH